MLVKVTLRRRRRSERVGVKGSGNFLVIWSVPGIVVDGLQGDEEEDDDEEWLWKLQLIRPLIPQFLRPSRGVG